MVLFLVSAALFFSALLSGIVGFSLELKDKKNLKLFLSLGAAYLFTICLVHLLPEVYENLDTEAGYYILFGFLMQIALEYFSGGLEHGHSHASKSGFPYIMLLSLSLHAIIEAMPIKQSVEERNSYSFVLGIIIHNIPISIILVQMLKESGYFKNTVYKTVLVFALMAPIGIGISIFISDSSSFVFDKMMAIVIGIFLHISTTILFETNQGHKFNAIKFLAVLTGSLLAIVASGI